MSKRSIVSGIDVGSHTIRVVVCEISDAYPQPRILGTGSAPSQGLRHGYIVNVEGTARALKTALTKAERASGVKISQAFLSAGGIGLEGKISLGTSLISEVNGEVGDDDIDKACSSAEMFNQEDSNKKILNTIPLSFSLDGKPVLGRPQGLSGIKLEVKALVITALSQHIGDLVSAADLAGVAVVDVFPSPISASCVTLSTQQKMAGCVLVNIGGETISIVVFENNLPVSLEVFPIGSTDITNDIALGLQISLEEAEKLKISRFPNHSRKKLEDIISERLQNVFRLIEEHLKKIGRNGLLPAGIIITGGGSGITTLEDMAKSSLKIPSSTAVLRYRTKNNKTAGNKANPNNTFKNAPSWAVAYGLCVLGSQSTQEESIFLVSKNIFFSTGKKISSLIKKFLP